MQRPIEVGCVTMQMPVDILGEDTRAMPAVDRHAPRSTERLIAPADANVGSSNPKPTPPERLWNAVTSHERLSHGWESG